MKTKLKPWDLDSATPPVGLFLSPQADILVSQLIRFCQENGNEWLPVPLSWLQDQIPELAEEMNRSHNLFAEVSQLDATPTTTTYLDEYGLAIWGLISVSHSISWQDGYIICSDKLIEHYFAHKLWCNIRSEIYAPYHTRGLAIPPDIVDEMNIVKKNIFDNLPDHAK